MNEPHVLVTGGAGFIGSHLVDRLLSGGCRITLCDLIDSYYDPALKQANLARHGGNTAVRFVQGDITNRAWLSQLLPAGAPRFDHIIHLAARVGVRASLTDPAAYIHHNIGGTEAMLEFARTALNPAGHFVFASSSSVYGDRSDGSFQETDSTDRPETVYAASKKAGELLCHAHHKLYGLRSIALRFFTVYGPRQRPEMAIAKFAHLIRTGAPVPLFGDPNSKRDYTYVADTCEGIARAMTSSIDWGVYNLGCGTPVTLQQMVDALGAALHKTPVIVRQPKAEGDVFMTFADIRAAQTGFGYNPQVSFAEGIRRYVESLPK